MSDETKIVVSEEMEKFISYIEKLTVLDLSQLVKALEQRLSDLLRRAEEIEEKVMEIQMKQAAAEMAAAEGRET